MYSKIDGNRRKLIESKPTIKNDKTSNSNKKNNKKQIIFEKKRKTEFKENYTKSPSKNNLIDDNFIKNTEAKKSKKIYNITYKNPIIKNEVVKSNININKLIKQKEYSDIKDCEKIHSSISPKRKNKINSNYNLDEHRKNANKFNEKDKINSNKKKRLCSDIIRSNKNKSTKTNSNNVTIKISKNKNHFTRLSPKATKNKNLSTKFNNEIDLFNIYNQSTKTNIKTKKSNINVKENKINNNLDINSFVKIKNVNTKIKYNYFKDIINNIKVRNDKNEKKINNNIELKSKTKTCTIKNDPEQISSNKKNNNNNIKEYHKKENEDDIITKEILYPIKNSLFSQHMNFILNHNDEKNNNKRIYNIENNYNNNFNYNYLNIPINSILQSTENNEKESKFINYELGKATGSSQIRDSLIAFGNETSNNNDEIIKVINISKTQNNVSEENERTKDELEKLAEKYLNISKNLENKNKIYNNDKSQMNTITTIIDNNFNEESF